MAKFRQATAELIQAFTARREVEALQQKIDMIQQKYDEQVSQAKALQGELSKRQLELQSKDKRISSLEQKLV